LALLGSFGEYNFHAEVNLSNQVKAINEIQHRGEMK